MLHCVSVFALSASSHFFISTISYICSISMLRSLWASSFFLAVSSSFSVHTSFVFSSRISSRRAALFRVNSVHISLLAAMDGRCFPIADIFSSRQAHSTCSVDSRSILGFGAPGCSWQGLRLAARIVGPFFWKHCNS